MKKTLLPSLLLLLLAACKKDAPEASLPAATQVGANTGGCLLNGQPFVASSYGGGLLSNPIPGISGGFAFDSVYYVRLSGQYQEKHAFVTVFIRPFYGVGAYFFNKKTLYYPQGDPLLLKSHATFEIEDSKGEVYLTDIQHNGKVEITLAQLRNSIGLGAGTFEFTAVSNLDPSKTVTITSGRFDRKQ